MGGGERLIVGIDLGGTNMQVGVVRFGSAGGFKIIGREKKKTKADQGLEGVLDRVAKAVQAACDNAGVQLDSIDAIGIGAPGVIDPCRGVVVEAVNLRWTDAEVSRMLRARIGRPVLLDNDVNAAVLGEHRHGAARGARTVLGVWVGTGIGGGLILNGEMWYGQWLSAGEIGHMWALPQCSPGNRSLEHNCSRSAIVDRITRLIRANRKSMIEELVDGDLTKIRSMDLAKAYDAGDDLVCEVVDHAAELLGIHLGSVNTLLSLETIVLGGGVTEALGKPWVERVAKWVRKVSFPDKAKEVDVVATRLADDAGVVGAAMLAAERSGDGRFFGG